MGDHQLGKTGRCETGSVRRCGRESVTDTRNRVTIEFTDSRLSVVIRWARTIHHARDEHLNSELLWNKRLLRGRALVGGQSISATSDRANVSPSCCSSAISYWICTSLLSSHTTTVDRITGNSYHTWIRNQKSAVFRRRCHSANMAHTCLKFDPKTATQGRIKSPSIFLLESITHLIDSFGDLNANHVSRVTKRGDRFTSVLNARRRKLRHRHTIRLYSRRSNTSRLTVAQRMRDDRHVNGISESEGFYSRIPIQSSVSPRWLIEDVVVTSEGRTKEQYYTSRRTSAF